MIPRNRLLASLPASVYAELIPDLQFVLLPQNQILHYSGEVIRDLYFPLDCLLSITITMNDGTTAETGLVGNREVLGINALMGGQETTQTEYVVQIPGSAIRVEAERLRQMFNQNSALRNILLRYIQAFIAQVSQTAACNRLHLIEQRLARWLLEVQDRINSNELQLTHEFISDMLGVRRAGVTQAAQKLQEAGLIQYRRGHVWILDQKGLEAISCECFKVVKNEYDRLLGQPQRDLVTDAHSLSVSPLSIMKKKDVS